MGRSASVRDSLYVHQAAAGRRLPRGIGGASGPGARRPPAALLPGHTGWPRGRFGGGPTPQGTRDGRRCLRGRPDMTRSERIYRKLLLAYPRSFRARYEDEMVRLVDQLRDADAAERPGEHAALWARSVADIASSAPSEHLRKESTVAKRVDPGSVALVVSPERSGPRPLGYAIASVPFVVILFATTFAPGFFESAFANRLRSWAARRDRRPVPGRHLGIDRVPCDPGDSIGDRDRARPARLHHPIDDRGHPGAGGDPRVDEREHLRVI